MSRSNAALSLPPGDRDDAPVFDLGEAIQNTPLVQDDAPPLTDETDEARLHRLARHLAEALKHAMTAVLMLGAHKHQSYAAAIHRCATDLTEAASLARVLSKSFTAKR